MLNENLNIIIDIPFIISVVANVSLVGVISLLAWYSTRLLKKIYFITDTVGEVNKSVIEFLNHLENVHSLDVYYGDATIQGLISHSKELKVYIEEYMLEAAPEGSEIFLDKGDLRKEEDMEENAKETE
jgi:hypothetical protein|tara:strand:- start:2270 stop:2653 length:384 start_codon:yes stop_codon:yes gene_type:complete